MDFRDDLYELRKRLWPQQPKRSADMSVQELANYIDTLVQLLHVRIDGLTPGGNDENHYEHHVQIDNIAIASAKFWADVRAKLVTGVIIGFGIVAAYAILSVIFNIISNLPVKGG